jgi:hypothetical protein
VCDPEHAGIPIYPPEHAKAKAYEVFEQFPEGGGTVGYKLLSNFLWAPDESCVVFLCIGGSKPTQLVCLRFSGSMYNPDVLTRPIMLSDWVRSPGDLEVLKSQEDKQGGPLSLSGELSWADMEHVRIKRSETLYIIKEEIILPLPNSK